MRTDGEAARKHRRRVITITVSINQRAWLAECFGTVTTSRAPGVDIESVLVDNASSDSSGEYVTRRHPDVTVLTTGRNEGFAGANNVGLRYALARGADFVFLLNPDTRTPPDLIGKLVEFMEAWPEYGIVGPLQYRYTADGSEDQQLNDWSTTALTAGESHIFDLDTPGLPSPAGPMSGRAPATLEHAYVQGAALMCRADVLRSVGPFDETYHSYYEESDLCRRARWGGWRVALCTDLGIQHFGGGGTGNLHYRRRKMLATSTTSSSPTPDGEPRISRTSPSGGWGATSPAGVPPPRSASLQQWVTHSSGCSGCCGKAHGWHASGADTGC